MLETWFTDSTQRNNFPACQHILQLLQKKVQLAEQMALARKKACLRFKKLESVKVGTLERLQRQAIEMEQDVVMLKTTVDAFQNNVEALEVQVSKAKRGFKENFRATQKIVSTTRKTLDNLQEMIEFQYNTKLLRDDQTLHLDCPHCQDSKVLSESHEILQAPRYLVVQMNRAYLESYLNLQNAKDKLGHPVIYPTDDLRVRTVGGTVTYDLVASSMHSGHTAKGGHYTAFVRDPDDLKKWYYCNDSSVTVAKRPPGDSYGYNAVFLVYQMNEAKGH